MQHETHDPGIATQAPPRRGYWLHASQCALSLESPRDSLTLLMMQADNVTEAELDTLLQAVRNARGVSLAESGAY